MWSVGDSPGCATAWIIAGVAPISSAAYPASSASARTESRSGPFGRTATPPRLRNGNAYSADTVRFDNARAVASSYRSRWSGIVSRVLGASVEHRNTIQPQLGDNVLHEFALSAIRIEQSYLGSGQRQLQRDTGYASARTDIYDPSTVKPLGSRDTSTSRNRDAQ